MPFTPASLWAGRDAILVAAPAKLNLFLELLGKRPDGFHEIATLMVAVDLFDTLEVRAAEAWSLECDPPTVPAGPANLVAKAAAALSAATGTTRGAAVRLTKRIPTEAGLAGGSADAAATLIALNRVWGLGLSDDELATVAAVVGSDVAFFLRPPAAWCTGRGEVVSPEPVGCVFDFVVVKPPAGCPTAAVYRGAVVPATPERGDAARAALRAGDAAALGRAAFNRLQGPAIAVAPAVGEALRVLGEAGPLGTAVSGSGSAVFGVCRDRADALRVAGAVRQSWPGGFGPPAA